MHIKPSAKTLRTSVSLAALFLLAQVFAQTPNPDFDSPTPKAEQQKDSLAAGSSRAPLSPKKQVTPNTSGHKELHKSANQKTSPHKDHPQTHTPVQSAGGTGASTNRESKNASNNKPNVKPNDKTDLVDVKSKATSSPQNIDAPSALPNQGLGNDTAIINKTVVPLADPTSQRRTEPSNTPTATTSPTSPTLSSLSSSPTPITSAPVTPVTPANPTPPAPSSSPSWIGSFIDSIMSTPFLNPKSASSNANSKGDDKLNLKGAGTIELGPLPEPVPPPLYLSGSKFSAPLSSLYSLSSGERNTTGDNAVIDMAQAFKRGDRKRLSATLGYASGHPLEPWAAYWELRARLDEASYNEVRDFFKRYAGTYQEDRLRNDWLLMLGQRREWDTLLDEYPYYRMRDDKELQCYYLLAQFIQLGPQAQSDTSELVLQNWQSLRDADDGCTLAVDRLYDARKISELDIWRKLRVATEYNQARLAKNALKIIDPKFLPDLEDIFKNPARFLSQPILAPNRPRDELITAALIRLSASDPAEATRQLLNRWISHLSSEQRTWVWAVAGKEAALKGDPKALEYFEHASPDKDIGNDELLAWKVRVALRFDVRPRWEMIEQATLAMSSNAQREPAWTYWRARALLQKKPQTAQNAQDAQTLFNSIAGVKGFYEQLALEEMGQKITSPVRTEPLRQQEINSVKANPALRRALYAINLGLRSEGTREWNYATNLVDNRGKIGGMSDRELLAAASYACELEVWDRCVNAAERAPTVDAALRFPMPFKDLIFARTKEIGLDPAYVYGLIRQESRFVMDARSNVGASGLMQIMPKTASWTAKKMGLINFKPESLSSRDVNITIGTGFLKLVLDSFDGSMPMAAAAYNAGPSRVRQWQKGSTVEGAIWAESLPFNETRDYVKKVLANTVNYQALITSEPQSLKVKLGTVGPSDGARGLIENPDLP